MILGHSRAIRQLEQASPHKLGVCLVIEHYILSSHALSRDTLCLLKYQIIQELDDINSAKEKGLDELCEVVQQNIGGVDGDNIVSHLTTSVKSVVSPAHLYELCERLSVLLKPIGVEALSLSGGASGSQPTHVSHASIFGWHLRGILLDVQSMEFSRLSSLFRQFVSYTSCYCRSVGGLDEGNSMVSARSAGLYGHTATINAFENASGFMNGADNIVSDLSGPDTFQVPAPESNTRRSMFSNGSHRRRSSQQSNDTAWSADSSSDMEMTGPSMDRSRELSDRRAEMSMYGPSTGPHGTHADASVLSSRQVQSCLQTLSLELESGTGITSQLSHDEIEMMIHSFLETHPELPRAYFALYLNSMQFRQRQAAEDSLHCYFDYGMRRGGANAKPGSIRSAYKTLQSAALNLGSLYFQQGDVNLAEAALDEAIRTAQHGNDKACVAKAMLWLHNILATKGDTAAATEILRRCLSRARELKLPELAAAANIGLAKASAMASRSDPDSCYHNVWHHLQEAHFDMGGGKRTTSSAPLQAAPFLAQSAPPLPNAESLTHALKYVTRQRLLMVAVAFSVWGYPVAAEVEAQALLGLHGMHANIDDVTLAATIVAHQQLCILPNAVVGAASKPGCVYVCALNVMNCIGRRFPRRTHPLAQRFTLTLLCEWCMKRGELSAAEELVDILEGLSIGDEAAAIESKQQLVALACAREDYEKALAIALAAEHMCKGGSGGLAPQLAKCLIASANVILEAGGEPTAAIEYVLRALAVAHSYSLDGAKASAHVLLARVLVSTGDCAEAIILLQNIIPYILQHSDVSLRAMALLTLAKAHWGSIGESSSSAAADTLSQAMLYAAEAAEYMQASHDVYGVQEVRYVQARMAHEAGDTCRRDLACAQFLKATEFLATKHSGGDVLDFTSWNMTSASLRSNDVPW